MESGLPHTLRTLWANHNVFWTMQLPRNVLENDGNHLQRHDTSQKMCHLHGQYHLLWQNQGRAANKYSWGSTYSWETWSICKRVQMLLGGRRSASPWTHCRLWPNTHGERKSQNHPRLAYAKIKKWCTCLEQILQLYHWYIKGYSSVTKPLTQLLGNMPFQWGDQRSRKLLTPWKL